MSQETIIPDVPYNYLSIDLKEALEKFPELLKNWKLKLQLHKFCVVINMADLHGHFHANGGGTDEEDFLRLYNSDDEMDIMSSQSDKSVVDLLAEKVVLVFAGYACHEQFAAGSEWPDSIGQSDFPQYILAEFKIGNTANVRLHDNGIAGTLCWEEEEIIFSGTWVEVLNHLIKLYGQFGKEVLINEA